jgi:L-ascorbate metabolism protein UlaG (beta-lactamase superfamily)
VLRLSSWVALGLIAAGAALADPAAVRLRWLGVAGFSVEAEGVVLLHDPYLSRPGLLRTLFFRYQPDADVLEPLMAAGGPAPELARARLVLVGHSHWDHLGDVAWLASRTGAAVAGSTTSAVIARSYGLAAERARPVGPRELLREGPFEIEVLESRHARVLAGRVPFQGEVTQLPEAPIHAVSFKMGGALGYLVTHRPSGLRIFHLSSAGLHPPALAALAGREGRVDVLLAPPHGRDADYARRLVTALRPRLVVPHHYDNFFRPLDHAEAAAPLDPEDLAAFEHEVREAARAADLALEVRRLALFEVLALSPGH